VRNTQNRLYKADGFIDREYCAELRQEAAKHVEVGCDFSVWPESPYGEHEPYAIAQHVDYFGFTSFCPCNRLGRVCTDGMKLDGARRHVEVLRSYRNGADDGGKAV
jgi:hypothetical protein